MIHDLKILPEYFVEVVRGNKTFEVRKDDRPFNVGDELILYEVNCGRYTGRNIKVIITYILRNPDYCKEGYCILGFKQPVKEWISVDEALPVYNSWVLVYDVSKNIRIGIYTEIGWCSQYENPLIYKVTHWQPLPEPPKPTE